MKILETITVFSFFGGIVFAECIPFCILCFAVSFSCGYICAKLEGSEEEENDREKTGNKRL